MTDAVGPGPGSSYAGARSLPEDGACAVRGAQTLFGRGLSPYLLLDCFLGEQGTGGKWRGETLLLITCSVRSEGTGKP